MFNRAMLEMFRQTSAVEDKERIAKDPNKSCDLVLASVYTCLLKKCMDQLLPLIKRLMAVSVMPFLFEDIYRKPLLTRSGLEEEYVMYHRHVSCLTYISKLIERVMTRQIEEHLQHNGLDNSHQSAYRRGHSAGTAPLIVHS